MAYFAIFTQFFPNARIFRQNRRFWRKKHRNQVSVRSLQPILNYKCAKCSLGLTLPNNEKRILTWTKRSDVHQAQIVVISANLSIFTWDKHTSTCVGSSTIEDETFCDRGYLQRELILQKGTFKVRAEIVKPNEISNLLIIMSNKSVR